MLRASNSKRIAAVLLAVVFSIVTVICTASITSYAADEAPAKVTGVKAAARTSSSVKVSWKKADTAEKYQIYRAVSKKGKYIELGTVKETSFIDTGLKSSKKYFYKVRAVNDAGNSKFSSVKSAKTKKASLSYVSVDKKAGTVTINAKINGTYFKNSTRHFIIGKKGFNAGKAIMTSYCTPEALYKGLVKAGGISWSKSAGKTLRDGEKNKKSNAENKNFSKVDVTVSWGNESHELKECLTTKKGGKKAPKIDMIFSGNPKAAARTPSGCVTCLDSCYIGIVANSAYGLCVIDNGNPTVYARKDVLPAGGKVVQVTFRIK